MELLPRTESELEYEREMNEYFRVEYELDKHSIFQVSEEEINNFKNTMDTLPDWIDSSSWKYCFKKREKMDNLQQLEEKYGNQDVYMMFDYSEYEDTCYKGRLVDIINTGILCEFSRVFLFTEDFLLFVYIRIGGKQVNCYRMDSMRRLWLREKYIALSRFLEKYDIYI